MKKNMLIKVVTLAMVVSIVMLGSSGSWIAGVGEPELPKRFDK